MKTLAGVMKKNAIDWVGKIVLAGIVGLVVSMYDPVRESIAIRWNILMTLDARLEKIESDVSHWEQFERLLRADIAALRNPARVFEISSHLSRAVKGYCIPGAVCELLIYVRRVPGSERCRIKRDEVAHYITHLETGIRRRAYTAEGSQIRDVGLEWEPVTLLIDIPDTVPSGASLYAVAAVYSDCSGSGSPLVRDESLPIPVELRETE